MANRYDDITVSGYTPQTMQELAFVPMMKREKHDKLLAENELIRSGLAKVDPLDVHYDEAMQLKRDIESQIDNTSTELSKHGINNDMIGKTIALNRKYQDLVAPTGRIGKINKSKELYNAEKARFLEAASKQYGSTRALELWNDNTKNYTGYGDPEKTIIKDIDLKGIVAAQNFDDDLKTYHSLLGETQSSASNSGYRLIDAGQGDGSKMMVNSSGQRVNSSNVDQLNEQRKLLTKKWLNDSGEGYIFNKEAGINLDNFSDRFDSAIDMQTKTGEVSKYDTSASFIPGPKGDGSDGSEDGFDNVEGIPSGEVEYTQKDVNNIKEKAKEIGKLIGTDYQTDASGAPTPTSQRSISPDEVFKKGTYERKLYDSAVKLAKAKKITLDQAIDLKSKEFEPMILKPDIINNQNLFPTMLINKDINLRNANIKNDLVAGTRSLYDPETGEKVKIDQDDWKDTDVSYYGMLSPVNLRSNKMLTKDQKISPHYVLVNGKTYLMSRTSTELKSNSFAIIRRINDTWNSMVSNSDEVIVVPKNWGKLAGLKVRYNSTNPDTPIEILNNKYKVVSRLNANQWIGVLSKNIK